MHRSRSVWKTGVGINALFSEGQMMVFWKALKMPVFTPVPPRRMPWRRCLRCESWALALPLVPPAPLGDSCFSQQREAHCPCSQGGTVLLNTNTFPSQTALQLSVWYSIETGKKNKTHSGVLFRLLGNDTHGPVGCPPPPRFTASPAPGSCFCRRYFFCSPRFPKWFSVLLPLSKIKLSPHQCLAAAIQAAASTTHAATPALPFPRA